MLTYRLPVSFSLAGFELEIFSVIPPERGCYTCQRFRHIAIQCRFSRPCCEFCAGHHHIWDCSHGIGSALCSNCFKNPRRRASSSWPSTAYPLVLCRGILLPRHRPLTRFSTSRDLYWSSATDAMNILSSWWKTGPFSGTQTFFCSPLIISLFLPFSIFFLFAFSYV